jgi:hypothetical protein
MAGEPDDDKPRVVRSGRTRRTRSALDVRQECPACGARRPDAADTCAECGYRSRRARRPKKPGPALRLVAGIGWVIDNRFGWLLILLLLLGGMGGIIHSFKERTLAARSSEQPQTVSLAELTSHGYGNNAHVIVTDFVADQKNFVYEYRSHALLKPFEGDGWDKEWSGVYVPIVPAGLNNTGAPAMRAIVIASGVRNKKQLPDWFANKQIEGTVVNSVKSLGSGKEDLLRQRYPGTDFSKCVIIEEGSGAHTTSMANIELLVGLLLLPIAGALLAASFVHRWIKGRL